MNLSSFLSKFGQNSGGNLSTRKILETVFVYTIALILFVVFDLLLNRFTESPFLTFTVTIILLLLFQPYLLRFLKKILLPKTYFLTTKAQRILEKLNNDLNHATHFNEVASLLYQAFDELFSEQAFIFYIVEEDKYYPAHYHNVTDKELLAFDLKSEHLEGIPLQTLHIRKLEKTQLPREFIRIAHENNLNSLFAFRGHNQIFAFLLINPEQIFFFHEAEAWKIFEKIQKKAGLILENTALIVDLRNRNYQMRKLLEVGHKILSSFDIKQILDFILSVSRQVAHYDAAAIFLFDEHSGELKNISYDGYDPAIIENLHLKIGEGSIGWVVANKTIDVIDDVRKSDHYYRLRDETLSQCAIPLIFDDKVLGVICLESDRLSFFNEHLVELLQLFGQMAAIAIHNANQFKVMLEKQALEHELINAGHIQKALLVQRFPRIKGLDISAVNIPSKIVSGDLYDIIQYDEFTVGLAIGDVSGKGAPAAITMALALAGLRSQRQFFMTSCDIVYRLNNLLYESSVEGNYVSFFYALVSTQKKKIIFTNAGHNPPILLKNDGQIVWLKDGGIVLGFQPDIQFKQQELEFEHGDIILMYTDGITEAMNALEEEFGEERLIKLLKENRHLPVYELRQKIIDAVQNFSGKREHEDDITLVLCKFE
ncbi:protein serine/threonine phosphatase with GAF(s) sensor(s) [Caldithrix abyssi DSM 13497]|uniref:Protein serine/threonine phosphatase with GAF(S) sensor(S) n=1 Tax=Caldithrix abyssi DSM 13497 TaxID=880073 RepID=H1XU82_CALAY|nr:Serine phosphatase RsbU, regulator of sigma subunit [Caldithrix abyssi DSM 13497]EHO41572.1 protein serine/threonine phosphatase with GAF(s) sensor(s) [Caldithrix abyssi DSM 13497]